MAIFEKNSFASLRPEGMNRFEVSAVTHPGLVRERNEDSFFYGFRQGEPSLCAAVADGIGGGCNGHIASFLTLKMLSGFWYDTQSFPQEGSLAEVQKYLEKNMASINEKIYRINLRETGKRYMGTTLAGSIFFRKKALLFHAGDSRICRIRSGVLTRLTADHNLFHENPELESTDPAGKALTRFIGPLEKVSLEYGVTDLEKDDLFLLATDGVFRHLEDPQIALLPQAHPVPEALCSALLARVLQGGAHDNASIIAVRVKDL